MVSHLALTACYCLARQESKNCQNEDVGRCGISRHVYVSFQSSIMSILEEIYSGHELVDFVASESRRGLGMHAILGKLPSGLAWGGNLLDQLSAQSVLVRFGSYISK